MKLRVHIRVQKQPIAAMFLTPVTHDVSLLMLHMTTNAAKKYIVPIVSQRIRRTLVTIVG